MNIMASLESHLGISALDLAFPTLTMDKVYNVFRKRLYANKQFQTQTIMHFSFVSNSLKISFKKTKNNPPWRNTTQKDDAFCHNEVLLVQ